MSTYSPSLRIELISTGDQAGVWGTTTNTNLGTLVETAIAGYISVSITSANQALTAIDGLPDQSRNMVLALTTTTAAAFAVYAPPVEKTYAVFNASAYPATIYNSTVIGNTTIAGIGAVIPAGRTIAIWSDGTNFAYQNTNLQTNATGALITSSGTTGQRDAAPVAGYFRFNTTLAAFEGYDGTAWEILANGTSPTGALITSSGTTGQRDAAPVAGYFRFNTTLAAFEGYDGTAWEILANGTSPTGALITSSGTTGQRDAAPVAGYFRFNTTLAAFEGYDGNVWKAVGGGATGGGANAVFVENDQIITVNYTITAGRNAMSTGPVTINAGVVVTVPSGSRYVVI